MLGLCLTGTTSTDQELLCLMRMCWLLAEQCAWDQDAIVWELYRALKEWKRVLKPQGYLAFSMWDFQQHQLMGVGLTVVQKITPGRRSPVLPQTLQDLGKQEPGLAVLRRLGFDSANCRSDTAQCFLHARIFCSFTSADP